MHRDVETGNDHGVQKHETETYPDAEKQMAYSIRGLETSEETSLNRALEARHISMIALGGALGTGLLIGTGGALAESGPGSVLIAFIFMGGIIFLIMAALGEVVAWLPLSAGFAGYASRYCHPAVGFALGWTYWFNYALAAPNQLTAGALAIQYWVPRETVNPGVFIAIFMVAIFCINYFGGIKFFGEFEFWLSSFKVIVIVGIILLSIILAAGGGPSGEATGFKYWSDPGAFAELYTTGPLGKFLGFWSVMINATFAYLGTELVGTTAAEAHNPRKSIPKAIRLTFFRIMIFYCLSVFLVGLLVPYNSEQLAFAASQQPGANASPFVVAAKIAGIKVLPHIINSCICLFVFSAANSDFYIASRTLYGLASDRAAPAIFKRTDRRGTPWVALLGCTSFALLAFMNVADDSRKVFKYFINLCTVLGLLTWMSILMTHIFFLRGRKRHDIPNSSMPYVAPQGMLGSITAMVVCAVIALTKNYGVFIRKEGEPFDHTTFITGYIGIPIYFILFFGHIIIKKSKFVKIDEMDFFTGKDIVDHYEAQWLEAEEAKGQGNSRWAKVYNRTLALLF